MEPETPMVLERKVKSVNIAYIESLLSSLPKEVVSEYEKKNELRLSAEVRAYKVAKRFEVLGYLVILLCVAGLAFAASHIRDSLSGATAGATVCISVLVFVILGAQKINSMSQACIERLKEFEVAADRVPRLVFTPMSTTDTRQVVEERLTSYAKDIIVAEEDFKKARGDDSCSVIKVVNAGQVILEVQNKFDRLMQTAFEFGLTDGNKRPFFTAAQKQLEASDAKV